MATKICKFCDMAGCTIMTQNTVTKEDCFYCSFECCAKGMASDKIDRGIDFTNREIRAFTNLRDSIKNEPDDWKRILPFVYGWLMFYLAVKRRDTRSRLKRLFDLALKKNQEVFSEIDGDKVFKETNPAVLLVLTKYLVKANQDITEEFIDLFATTDS